MKRRDWEVWVEGISSGPPRRYRAHVIGMPGERQNAGNLESELGLWRELEDDVELEAFLKALGVDAIRKQTGFRRDGQPEFENVDLLAGTARSALEEASSQLRAGPATLVVRNTTGERLLARIHDWQKGRLVERSST
jgi:hypothetical protein